MAKKRYKQEECLNCRFSFNQEANNFCPSCGQENTLPKIGFFTLLLDYLGDTFSFDSKIFSSVYKLLFFPGKLSKEFNEGKRVRSVPPLRMLIILSFVFFLLFSMTGKADFLNIETPENLKLSADSLVNDISKSLNDAALLTDSSLQNLPNAILDSIRQNTEIDLAVIDSLEKSENETLYFEGDSELAKGLTYAWEAEKRLTLEELKDSLQLETQYYKNIIVLVIKIKREGTKGLNKAFMGNLSLMILLLIPVFAFILKLFYIRRPFLYIDHLISAFHIHSFFYLLMSLALIIGLLVEFSPSWYIIILMGYLLVHIKKLYMQTWSKSIIKTFFILCAYSFCVLVSIVITLGFSFYLFN